MSTSITSRLELQRRIDPITLKDELVRLFPQYTVTYSVMTDSFKIGQSRFSHRLEYNTHKASRLESRGVELRRFTFFFNLGLVALIILLVIMDRRWTWGFLENDEKEDLYFFGLILIVGLMQYLIPVLKPGLKRDLEAEHVKVRHVLEGLLG